MEKILHRATVHFAVLWRDVMEPQGCYHKVLRLMRITFIQVTIAITLCGVGMAGTNYGQGVLDSSITLNYKEVTLKKAIANLGKKMSIKFAYSGNFVNLREEINVEATDIKVRELLDRLLKPRQITYSIQGDYIVLTQYKASPTGATSDLSAKSANELSIDNITVTGKVTDETGTPLPGANVLEKGTTNGTTTDANGDFSLTVKDEKSVLVISFIGYSSKEILVGTQTQFPISIESDISTLGEVVVVGYGSQKKINVTGSVASVDNKALESRPLTNLGQGLQGLIPNLNVSPGNGRPGARSGFNIRGTTSLNGGEPLVLVDGVQMDPNQINPSDVESVTVLKDAASCAVYGVRGAYGVILIKTRTGQKNTPVQINYSFDYTLTRPTRLPKTMNSVDYINTFMEANETGAATGGGTASNAFTAEDLQRAKNYMQNPTPENAVYVDPGNPNLYRYVGNTDWVEALYPSYAPQMQHNLSFRGGDEKTTYIASLGYFNQEGILRAANQDFNRYNGSLKIDSDIKSWLTLNFRMQLNRVKDNSPANIEFGSIERLSGDLRPIMPIYHPDGRYSGQGNFTNTFAVLNNNGRSITNSNDLWLTGGFELRPIKNVKVVSNYTWNSYNYNNTENRKAFNEYGANGVLLGVYPWTATPRVFERNSNDSYTALNSYAEYENTFGRHYIKGMIGYNQELKQVKGFNANVRNLINQDIPAINLNSDPKPNAGGGVDEWAVSGTFFRVNYALNEKYLIEVNGRYDGTSRFARGNRYTFQPSFSVGWRISEESFFESLSGVVTDLKLRASYGTLGNQQLTNSYPYIPSMSSRIESYIFGNQQQTAVYAPGLVSADFTWEEVTTKNFALDFGFLNNRLTGSFDYYVRDTKDMIVAGTPKPAVLGTSVPSRNAADLTTKGFELSLRWQDKITTDLTYNVAVALSDYKAEITRYDNPNGVIGVRYVGESYDEIWGFETEGFYQSDAEASEIDNSAIWGGTWLAGDIKYRDLNNDGKITRGNGTLADPGDMKVIGNRTPRYQYSVNASMQYKGFDFTMFFQGVGKRDMMLGGNFFWGYGSEWHVPTEAHVGQYWTPENTNAYFPRLRFGGGGNFQTQTKYLQSAAYLRMKQITIGYTFPQQLLNKVKIDRIRLYFTSQNLFEFTKLHKNYDPEQFDRQWDYPLNRGYSFGIQVGL